MNPKVFNDLLADAKQELQDNPFDAGHDYAHHEETYNSALKILSGERLKVDKDALTLALWLHDYERNNESKRDELVGNLVKKYKLPDSFSKKVVNIMSTHSFGEKQESNEQKILYDADKLEYLSVSRFKRVIAAVEAGSMPEVVWAKYRKAWQDRLPKIKDLLNFDTSKDLFRKRSKDFLRFLHSDSRLFELEAAMI